MKVKRFEGNKVIIEEVPEEKLKEDSSFSASKEFWDNVHKQAVIFRNIRRKEYLAGMLSKDENKFVEEWDKRPRNLREEPLSLDIGD